MSPLATDEAGLTLVELIIAIAILGIIIVPLTGAVMIGLVTTPIAGQRTANSADAELLASYVVPDVQSATPTTTGSGVTSGIAYQPTTPACVESGVGGTPQATVFELAGIDPVTPNTSYYVDYFTWQPAGATQLSMSRVQCESGATSQPVTVIRSIVASSVAVSINNNSCAASPTPSACSTPPLGSTFKLSLTDSGGSSRTTPYAIQVAATQRAATPSLLSASGSSGSASISVLLSDHLCRSAPYSSTDWTVLGSVQGAIAVSADNIPVCNAGSSNGVTSATLTTTTPVQAAQTVTVALTPSGSSNLRNLSLVSPSSSAASYSV